MKRAVQMLFLSFLVFLLPVASVCHARSLDTVEVVLNGTLLTQGILLDSRTLVPIRILSENFGYEVLWAQETKSVTVRKDDLSSTLSVDDTKVVETKNGQTTHRTLDCMPVLFHDRTYVPIRYIAEIFGRSVFWQEDMRRVLIGDAHTIAKNQLVYTTSNLDVNAANSLFGVPVNVNTVSDAVQRYYYMDPQTRAFTVVGFYADRVFEFFTNDTTVSFDGTRIGELQADASLALPGTVHVFRDALDNDRPVALYMNVSGKLYQPYRQAEQLEADLHDEAWLVEQLVNSIRAQHNASPLLRSSELDKVDAAHVTAMKENSFFAHAGLSGDTIRQRILTATRFSHYLRVGENLAYMPNAYFACYGWLNSKSHRENMLYAAYTYTGISIDGIPNENLYYAQVFVRL